MESRRVSFVVLSRNSGHLLRRCLDPLLENAADEAWVVDNGSTDDSARILAALQRTHADRLNAILLGENVGTTVSRNLALRRCRGEFVGIVDSDVVIPSGAIDSMIRSLAEFDRCGIVAPRLVRADGSFQLSTDVFPTLPRKLHRVFRLKALERQAGAAERSAPRPVEYAISAFWLMRRRLLSQVGLFDEQIFYAPEDAEYCVRVWKAGQQVVYDPRVEVVHDAQEISRRPGRAAWIHVKGLVHYFAKHNCTWSAAGIRREIRRRFGEEVFTAAGV
jgi:GT2 family glycosyltransferase